MNIPMFNPDAVPVPFARFREHALDLYRPPLRSPATFKAVLRTLRRLEALGGVETTADLTTATVARLIAARRPGESPNTTRTTLARVSALCSIAVGEGYLRVSPFAIRKGWVRRVTPRTPAVHSRAEIARVLDLGRRLADEGRGWQGWRARRTYALVALVAYTGLRRNEALYLRVEDLDFDAGMILLRARVGGMLKTDAAAQPVPIPAALAPILRAWVAGRGEHPAWRDKGETFAGRTSRPAPRWVKPPPPAPDGGWVFPNTIGSGPWTGGTRTHKPIGRLKRLGNKADVRGLTFQSLRHSWATHAEYWGLSDAMIQRVLRHTNTRTQWHYRHADSDNLRDKVGGIGFGEARGDRSPAGRPGGDGPR